jgi:hypothetical protein
VALLDADDLVQAMSVAGLAGGPGRRGWQLPGSTPLAARRQVDATVGALLETLSFVPDLFEILPAH